MLFEYIFYKLIFPIICMGLALMVFLFGECSHSKPMPTDKEMIDNFMSHQEDFSEIKNLVLKIESGCYYPPFYRGCLADEKDGECDKWLTQEERDRLDSLLKIVGCERIYYRDRESYYGVECDSTLTLTYWCRGLSIGGTWKEYVFRPDFERMAYRGEKKIYQGEETGSLLQSTNCADTIVYKPICGEWYIEFGHDN